MLWFELALEMGLPVAEAQQRISAREFGWWKAFDRISPIGRKREDMHAALIAFVGASVNSTKKLKLDDFVLRWAPKQVRRRPWREIKAKLTAFALTHNALFRASQGNTKE